MGHFVWAISKCAWLMRGGSPKKVIYIYYIYLYMHTCVHIYGRVYYIYMYAYMCMCMCIYIYLCIRMYTYIYICIILCVYIFTYIYMVPIKQPGSFDSSRVLTLQLLSCSLKWARLCQNNNDEWFAGGIFQEHTKIGVFATGLINQALTPLLQDVRSCACKLGYQISF
jgi:hypothetical protein